MTLKSLEEWKLEYDNTPKYSRRELNEALAKQAKELQVNRVIQSFNGRVGPNCSIAMQILAIHKTHEGITVIVR